jgi:hypothetical protein
VKRDALFRDHAKADWYVLYGLGVLKITLAVFGESRVRNTDRCLAFLATQIFWYKEEDFQK